MPTNYHLTMRKGPDVGREYSLTADTITLGRDPMVDIVINDPEVSRQHARLIRRGNTFLVEDLGSTNGTFLDGRRLAGEPIPIVPGQVITIGSNVSLILEAQEDMAATIMATDPFDEDEDEEKSVAPAIGVYDLVEPEDDLWAEEDDLPTFGGAQTTPIEERDTILDTPSPPHDLSYQDRPEDLLPDFGAPSPGEPPSEPYLRQEPAEYRAAPPPPEPPRAAGSNRTRNTIVIVAALLLLCCCCIILSGYLWWGDLLLEALEEMVTPVP